MWRVYGSSKVHPLQIEYKIFVTVIQWSKRLKCRYIKTYIILAAINVIDFWPWEANIQNRIFGMVLVWFWYGFDIQLEIFLSIRFWLNPYDRPNIVLRNESIVMHIWAHSCSSRMQTECIECVWYSLPHHLICLRLCYMTRHNTHI